MSAPIRRRGRPRVPADPSKPAGGALTLEARPGSVTLGAIEVAITLSSAEAREVARLLLDLADAADAAL